MAFILGDGLFNIVRVFIITIASLRRGPVAKDSTLPLANGQGQHVYSQATSTSAAADADEARLKHSLAPSAEHEGEGSTLLRASRSQFQHPLLSIVHKQRLVCCMLADLLNS